MIAQFLLFEKNWEFILYTLEEKSLIWLDSFDFLSYQKKIKIIEIFDKENIRELWDSKIEQLSTFLSKAEIEKVKNADEDRLEKVLDWYNNKNIQVITLHSSNYPKLLQEIDTPPICLYCMGNTQLFDTITCGVVGTRKPSEYGKVCTKQFVTSLAKHSVTIVSGLASGIDTIAHETALQEEGCTIAVIAGGFDHIFPASNHQLFKTMIVNNLVVTESLPNVFPSAYLFPIRNRIIAGLSRAVFIPEAGKRSGSLHTKNYAVNYNREVFALPGRITSPESEGTNQIIKECQASLCLEPKEILDYLGVVEEKNAKKPAIQLDITEQSILNYILAEKKTYQEILDYTKLKPNELNTVLFNMQMKGLVEKLAGNSYIALIKL